jgi:hypothetical protein
MPRINRKNKKNGTRTKTKQGIKYVVFCSECNPISQADPEVNIHKVVDGTNPPKFIICKNGHKTEVHR